jgi:peptide/nickel transport system ATP-binding protein
LQDVILSVLNIKKYFYETDFRHAFHLRRRPRHSVRAVDDISFEVERGKVFVLAGESGSGKTTLAKIILRAIDPDSGSIIFDGENITTYTGKKLKEFRNFVQMVHQDPYTSLNPRMRIMDIIMEPLNIHDKQSSNEEKREKVLSSLEDVRLEPAQVIAEKFPYTLSGGQRQRVALARVLVISPKLIVADEPVSMLDVSVRAEILQLMKNLKDKFKISFLYITHDLSTSRYIGDDIAVMYAGTIVERGPIDRILLNPLHPYTQALTDAIFQPNMGNSNNERKIRIKQSEVSYLPDNYTGCRFFSRCPYYMNKCTNEPILTESNEKDHYVSCFLYP